MQVEKAVYTVKEIQQILGIGRVQAYKLMSSGYFPVRRLGNKYLVSKEGFLGWLHNDNKKDSVVRG